MPTNPDFFQSIGAILGFLGFSLSVLLAYLGHLRPAAIELLPGSRLQFYPAPSQTLSGIEFLGGLGFYLPLTVHNWSSKGGVLYKVRLVLRPKHSDSICYDMMWAEFAEMAKEERRWISARYAQALPIDGHSSRTEVVQFQWIPGGELLEIHEGEYEIVILGWTQPRPTPQIIFVTHTRITAKQARDYKRAVEARKPLTIELPVGEDSRWNRTYHRSELEANYGKVAHERNVQWREMLHRFRLRG